MPANMDDVDEGIVEEEEQEVTPVSAIVHFLENGETSSVGDRVNWLSQLAVLADAKDESFTVEAIKKVIVKLAVLLNRYVDRESRLAVRKIFASLARSFPDVVVPLVPRAFDRICAQLTSVLHGGASVQCLELLAWSAAVVQNAFAAVRDADQLSTLALVQAKLLDALLLGNRRIHNSARLVMGRLFKDPAILAAYYDAVEKWDAVPMHAALLGLMVRYTPDELFTQRKAKVFAAYSKAISSSKTAIPAAQLEGFAPILERMGLEEYKADVFPATQKMLLRNSALGTALLQSQLGHIRFDASTVALDMEKSLHSVLNSKEAEVRDTAVEVYGMLANTVHDAAILKKLAVGLVDLVAGKTTKITIWEHRVSVLRALGLLAQRTKVSSNAASCAEAVIDGLLTYVKKEAHEGTQAVCVETCGTWLRHLSKVPASLQKETLEALKPAAKAGQRLAFLRVLARDLQVEAISSASAFVALLLDIAKKVDKGVPQPAAIIEALLAAYCLVNWSIHDVPTGTKVRSDEAFWRVVCDTKLFVSEKFMAAATPQDHQVLTDLAVLLFSEHKTRVVSESSQWHTVVVLQCASNVGDVRRVACAAYPDMLARCGSQQLSSNFLAVFTETFLVGKAGEEVNKSVLAVAASLLCTLPSSVDVIDRYTLALELLRVYHHPRLHMPREFAKALRRLGVPDDELISNQTEAVYALVTGDKGFASQDATDQQTALNALATVVRASPDDVLPLFINHATDILDDNKLLDVKEIEYGIYRTPDGELYNDEMLAVIKRTDNEIHNIKRSSKLYSVEEEKWEMELRRELARKRGEDVDKPKLTKHQQEMLDKQRAKERDIRERVRALDEKASRAFSILSVCVAVVPDSLEDYIPDIVPRLMRLLPSPLVSRRSQSAWVDLSACLPRRMQRLAVSAAFATMRLANPYDPVDANWLEMELSALLASVTERLDKMVETAVLPESMFAYIFNLLDRVLHSPKTVPMAVLKHAMAVLCRHTTQVGVSEEYPRKECMRLLEYVTAEYDNMQAKATDALESLCMAAGELPEDDLAVLLEGSLSPVSALRLAVLQGLRSLQLEPVSSVVTTVWLARHDDSEEIQEEATSLWEENEFELTGDMVMRFTGLAESKVAPVRDAAARALAAALQWHPEQVNAVTLPLLQRFMQLQEPVPPVMDEYGNVISERHVDPWEARLGIANALKAIAPSLTPNELMTVVDVFVNSGFADEDERVRAAMLNAALEVIDVHGGENIPVYLPLFENYLDDTSGSTYKHDIVRESVVICLGAMARHLDKDDPKVPPIIAKLIVALRTPSQQVQEAVARCLPPLVPAVKDEAGALIEQLMKQLLEGEKYAERKGAAYGLAGVVKGIGILSLKQHNIVPELTEAIQDKQRPKYREGALMAFETLIATLGRLFEPYVIRLLPFLLVCFGDGNKDVREAAEDAAKAIVKHLSESRASGPGVKLVLPSLLKALEDKQWRTKQGAVEMLGAMSHCAPDQLSSSLPQIVPRVTEVLTDSHVKVQDAARKTLREIGSVIKNPEIQAIADVLLDALADPNRKTQRCLTKLLDTNFVHFIDAPSLALIMPVLQRALKQRDTETKMHAAQIIGNMSSLTNHKDLEPYLPQILPGLKQVLVDANPLVREISAKALGTMVKGMGEEHFADLIPWLIETLKTDNSSVDRQGAAQGLSEVLYGLGVNRLEALIPDIIANTNARQPYIREGFLLVFVFLPASFGPDLQPFIGSILPAILKGLADEAENVRDASLKAGQMIVNNYCDTSVELFLPELEEGLFDDNWRIRQSSVHLLGDLLYRITGMSGAKTTASAHDDDTFGVAEAKEAIIEALGVDRAHRVLAGLYMARQDVSVVVRQASLHIWKVVVFNTARTLREVLPVLMNLLLHAMASDSFDKRQTAARTVSDLMRKLGERVLPDLIPIIDEGLESDDTSMRCGVCVALSEIMNSTSRDIVIFYLSSLIPAVRRALCDSEAEVREAAAQTFNTLHTVVGIKAIDEILPVLLEALDDPDMADNALHGLRQIMAVKSHVVLPFLVPKLTAEPVTAANAHALKALAEVSGEALNRHIETILPPLLDAITSGSDESDAIRASTEDILLAVDNEEGVQIVITDLLEHSNSENASVRCAATQLLAAFCERTEEDLTDYVDMLLQKLLHRFNDDDEECVKAGWQAVSAVTATIKKEDQAQYIASVRRTIKSVARDYQSRRIDELPGFCLPKGISPILPMFLHGLIYGTPETREIAAAGLGDIIALTSAAALKPFVIQITGPLIRVIADRFAWQVKAAILETLEGLIVKVGAQLKAFLPQLQTTFLKALADPTDAVRTRAVTALAELVVIHVRVDPLLTDLCSGAKTAEEPVRVSMLRALAGCLPKCGDRAGDAVKTTILDTLTASLVDPNTEVRSAAALCVGKLGPYLADDVLESLVEELLEPASGGTLHARMAALGALLAPGSAGGRVWPAKQEAILDMVTANCGAPHPLGSAAVECAGNAVLYLANEEGHTVESAPPAVFAAIAKALANPDLAVKTTATDVSRIISKDAHALVCTKPVTTVLVPPLYAITKAPAVREKAERALMHLLALRMGDSLLMATCKAIDPDTARILPEYAKRTLTKQTSVFSDDEDDDE